jgi:DNA polymerase-3 subunit delta'
MAANRNADAPAVPAPRETPDLVGHEAAERRLLDTWRAGRLGHAWIIAGPQGVGKATLAYRLTRFLFTAEGAGGAAGAEPDSLPDSLYVSPQSAVFQRVASGGHADLITLERSIDERTKRLRSEIVVDDARKLGEFFSLTAGEGGWRVAIVDSADELNRNAANALLKVLEEPPERALLLLVAHAPGRLLPTIRSRCRKLTLGALDEATVAELLARHWPDLGEDERRALARLAEGSAGRALTLAAQGGLDLYRDLVGLLAALPGLDVRALHALCDRLAPAAAEPAYRTTTALLERWLARLIRAAAGAPTPEIMPGETDAMRRLAAAGGLDRWIEVWEKIARLRASAESVNLDRKQVLLSAFTSLESAARP